MGIPLRVEPVGMAAGARGSTIAHLPLSKRDRALIRAAGSCLGATMHAFTRFAARAYAVDLLAWRLLPIRRGAKVWRLSPQPDGSTIAEHDHDATGAEAIYATGARFDVRDIFPHGVGVTGSLAGQPAAFLVDVDDVPDILSPPKRLPVRDIRRRTPTSGWARWRKRLAAARKARAVRANRAALLVKPTDRSVGAGIRALCATIPLDLRSSMGPDGRE